jgi:putative heme-binding domain-containing protein
LAGLNRDLKACTLFVVAAPRSNAGLFRGILAFNETGKNDYTTGLTLDLTGESSTRLDRLNVEGAGFGGAVNLLGGALPFGKFATIEVVCQDGPDGVQLVVDGKPGRKRDRKKPQLRLDEICLGARFYSNTADPGHIQGFLDGDIAEVLLFDRVLSAADRTAVRAYLAKKHKGLAAALEGTAPTRVVANPPPVQVLAPGFIVRKLPVDLPNINNIKYREDGKLVALGYNGNVYVLSDTDADGLEDKAELFWDNKGRLRGPIGMVLTPKDYKKGQGVFVASKGKISLLVDSKGTGRADKEIAVAKGWKELPVNVDALGVAMGKDGKIYFGLGTPDYSNGYLLDKNGKAAFDLKGEHGTILEVSSDFKTRKVICTGIRFPVALAFNHKGDLFATDQEGATWLANGNPFDELLHIQAGRHYGFPPRHPKHLPGVIDEPSVFDYGPQHQSTCGLNFNEPVNGGPVFGPKLWRGDALVSGYSRGKLYRTQLAPTTAGYVARNHLLACLNMLTVDACVSPTGDLVVAVHSGAPDWGSGPTGKGNLYKISYTGKYLANPTAIWPAGPREVRIAFDKPLDPLHLRDLAKKSVLEFGPYVRAGDRFESLRPGYAVVGMQQAAPRLRLPIYGASVTADRRTLVLTTAPHPAASFYALTLPGLGRPLKPEKGALPQIAETDLDYELSGVQAQWRPKAGTKPEPIWLPHVDLSVARAFTAGSAEHDAFWTATKAEGMLALRTKLDLWQMLRPAVQPGSRLDFEHPPERVKVAFRAPGPFTVKLGKEKSAASKRINDKQEVTISIGPKENDPADLEVLLSKEKGQPTLEIVFSTNEDKRERALPLRRFVLPWAQMKTPDKALAMQRPPELVGGSWLRGQEVFRSEQALCFKCHVVRGEGGRIGPDLSNLVHRDYASVLKDIRQPSAALNPDHLGYVIRLNSGKVLTGVPRTLEDGKVVVGDEKGVETILRKDQIESMTPSPKSVMPEGIEKQLGPEKMRDLMTFLLTAAPEPAPLEARGAPPPRTRAEVAAVLKGINLPQKAGKKLHIVLAAGPKDHGPGEHDYPLWQRRWFNLLSLADNVRVDMATGWPSPGQMKKADVIVFYSANPSWTAERAKELDAFLAHGGGLVYLHYAVDGRAAVDDLAERIGLAWRGGKSRYRHGTLELTFLDPKHPITKGFNKVKFVDESYWELAGDPKRIHLLASGIEGGKAKPLLWSREHGKGRVFVSILGHYTWTFDDPLFRILILRGLCWTAREPADRLTELATIGARIKD